MPSATVETNPRLLSGLNVAQRKVMAIVCTAAHPMDTSSALDFCKQVLPQIEADGEVAEGQLINNSLALDTQASGVE